MRSRKGDRPKDRRFELRLADEDHALLQSKADIAALTNSEYIRCLIRGHRIANRNEERLWNELRRLGGLQKHLATRRPDLRNDLNRVLSEIVATLKSIRMRGQEDEQ
jgi:predicted  nucleic acid-binding Zn-ribbon protein